MLLKLLSFLTILLPIMAQDSHMYPQERHRGYGHMENKGMKNWKPQNIDKEVSINEEEYMLPKSIYPISYFIRLQPFIDGDKTVTGYSEIVFEAVQVTSIITLHMQDITYDGTSFLLESIDGIRKSIDFTEHSYNSVTNLYSGSLVEKLEIGRKYKLSLNYQGIINDEFTGLYQSSYINRFRREKLLATTQFQPTSARRAFPCFDEPTFKATFQMEIGHQAHNRVLSNTALLSTRPIEGSPGWTWDLFDVTPIMSSYLVAFVVCNFINISTISETGTVFNTWSNAQFVEYGQYSLEVSPGILSFFENYFDIAYPLPKQDQIAIPDFSAGAMENWGLVTYREEALLLNPVLDKTEYKRSIVQTIGHEFAHMWLGNLVTTEWWSDLWLNEGFASYYQYVGTNAVEADMDVMIGFVEETLQYVLKSDSSINSAPIRYDVTTPPEISAMFSLNTYFKGASIVRMMEHFLTHDTFLQGLKNYLNENAYGNTLQEDLFIYLDDQAKLDGTLDQSMFVEEIMQTWTLQPGFPLITVNVNGDGTATLNQKQFLDKATKNTYTYWVPISYASDTINTEFDSAPLNWMSPSDKTITITGLSPTSTWHIFNTQQAYYYRVNYDNATWNGIATQLADDYASVDIRNRAQLLDDSFILAEAGIVEFDVPFSIASYLNNEDHYVPWKSFINNIEFIEKMLSRTVAYSGFRNYLRRILTPVYDVVGAVDQAIDPDRTLFLRDSIVPWACDMKYYPCSSSANAQFAEWMLTPEDYSIISPNLKAAVYCTAIREGSDIEWKFALNHYHTTNSNEEADHLLFAMACSQDHATLLTYLDKIYNGQYEIEPVDISTAFGYIASTDIGRDIAWDYLVNNYHTIAEFYYDTYVSVQSLADEASQEFNTEKDLFELKTFRDILMMETSNTDIIDDAILNVENNIAWMRVNYDAIADWLYENGYEF